MSSSLQIASLEALIAKLFADLRRFQNEKDTYYAKLHENEIETKRLISQLHEATAALSNLNTANQSAAAPVVENAQQMITATAALSNLNTANQSAAAPVVENAKQQMITASIQLADGTVIQLQIPNHRQGLHVFDNLLLQGKRVIIEQSWPLKDGDARYVCFKFDKFGKLLLYYSNRPFVKHNTRVARQESTQNLIIGVASNESLANGSVANDLAANELVAIKESAATGIEEHKF